MLRRSSAGDRRRSARGRLLAPAAALSALVLAACGGAQSGGPAGGDPSSAGNLLPREAIVALGVAQQHFPEITKEAETGANPTVIGEPSGTRSVAFTNDDGSIKLTLSMDQYASADAAAAAYQTAVQGSVTAPGYQPAPAPGYGQESFAGSSQVGTDQHFGLGARDGA